MSRDITSILLTVNTPHLLHVLSLHLRPCVVTGVVDDLTHSLRCSFRDKDTGHFASAVLRRRAATNRGPERNLFAGRAAAPRGAAVAERIGRRNVVVPSTEGVKKEKRNSCRKARGAWRD